MLGNIHKKFFYTRDEGSLSEKNTQFNILLVQKINKLIF